MAELSNEITLNGIQQIGIGVQNANRVFNWYRRNIGFNLLVFKDEATASLMTKYTGGKAWNRKALLSLNLAGGGGLEIWQYTNRKPIPPIESINLGDLGINILKLKSKNITSVHKKLQTLNLDLLSPISTFENQEHFFFKDPWDNLVQIVTCNTSFTESNKDCGGVLGVTLGVSDIDTSITFYKSLLGFDTVVYDKNNTFEDFSFIDNQENNYRRTLLRRSETKVGGFGTLLGPCEIELIQKKNATPKKIYANRYWGDLGYIHLCFDVSGMKALGEKAKKLNHPFTVDSSSSFEMGEAAGHFSYIEDPDGTLLEFVETHKVPIIKKLGLFINLKKRNHHKPLPNWLIKLMRVHRVKKDL